MLRAACGCFAEYPGGRAFRYEPPSRIRRRPPVRAAPFLHAQRGRPRHRGADRTNMEEQQVAPMAVHQIRDSKVKGSESVPTGGYGVDDLKLVWSGGGAVERHAGARPRSRASKPTAGHVFITYHSTHRAVSIGLVLSDAACIVGALVCSYYLRYHGMRSMPLNELAIVAVAPSCGSVSSASSTCTPLSISLR